MKTVTFDQLAGAFEEAFSLCMRMTNPHARDADRIVDAQDAKRFIEKHREMMGFLRDVGGPNFIERLFELQAKESAK